MDGDWVPRRTQFRAVNARSSTQLACRPKFFCRLRISARNRSRSRRRPWCDRPAAGAIPHVPLQNASLAGVAPPRCGRRRAGPRCPIRCQLPSRGRAREESLASLTTTSAAASGSVGRTITTKATAMIDVERRRIAKASAGTGEERSFDPVEMPFGAEEERPVRRSQRR